MNNKKLILASSFVLIGSVVLWTLNTKTPKRNTPNKVTVIKNYQEKEKKQFPIEKEITPIIKKEIITTSYNISTLPQNMTIEEKKQRFNELLKPTINKVHSKLQRKYNQVEQMVLNNTDSLTLEILFEKYNVDNTDNLLKRLKPHPKSIALAQAAIQSGWATSRFTLIANNLFGVWSFNENEPRIQANDTSDTDAVFIKKYDSLEESIEDYYELLAKSHLFEEFREKKMQTDEPAILIKYLDKYYKKDADYQKGLLEVIKYNNYEKE